MPNTVNRRVSLTLFARLPAPSGGERLTAILQRRGRWNHEENFGPESWRGGCQPTVCGRVEESDGPGFYAALRRETAEEIGVGLEELDKIFGTRPMFLVDYLPPTRPAAQGEPRNGMESFDFALPVRPEALGRIRWHFGSGGAELVAQDRLASIVDIKTLIAKEEEVAPPTIAMSARDIEVLRKGFSMLLETYQASLVCLL